MSTKTLRSSKLSPIARLPRAVREQIGRMLLEGDTPDAILTRLSQDPVAEAARITHDDIASWRQSGYQDWLEERERLENLERVRELARQVNASGDGAVIQEASLQIVAARIYELLAWFNPKAFRKKVHNNLTEYARLVNVLVKLGDGGLKYERYRAQVADRKAEMERTLERENQCSGLSPEGRAIIERELKLL